MKKIASIILTLVLLGGLVLVLINGTNQVEEMNLGELGNETRGEVVPFIRITGIVFTRGFIYLVGGVSILALIMWIPSRK